MSTLFSLTDRVGHLGHLMRLYSSVPIQQYLLPIENSTVQIYVVLSTPTTIGKLIIIKEESEVLDSM
jgi:hypothetical protein